MGGGIILVEATGLSVGVCLFGMVILVDCFVLLGSDFLGKDDGCESGDRGCG